MNAADELAEQEWLEREARLLPCGAILTAPGRNDADFRRRAYAWLVRTTKPAKLPPALRRPAAAPRA